MMMSLKENVLIMMLIKIVHIADYNERGKNMIMTILKKKGDDDANVVDNKLNKFLKHSPKSTRNLKQ